MYYAANNIDKIVRENFFSNKTDGFFLDIGAFDGTSINNTLHFEESGWNGICFEPFPEIYKELSKNRKCKTINKALSNKTETRKFFKIDENDKVVFAESNYMEVGYGLEFFDSDYFKRIYQEYEDKGVIQKIHEHNSESLKYSYDNSIPALDFIKLVKIAYDDNQLDDFKKLLKIDEPKEKEKSKSWKLW